MTQADADRNLLTGVVALQAGLIDAQQFADACTLWTRRKAESLCDILAELGALEAEDRTHVEYLARRALKRHGDDVHATLAFAKVDYRVALGEFSDDAIRHTLAQAGVAASSRADSTTILGRIEHDRIRRKTLHSTGGIGHVWLAYDEVIGRDIALKELRSDRTNVSSRERFRREAKLTGRLEHPGIVPVYDLVESRDGDHCYYTMRFLRGRTLSEVVGRYHHRRSSGADSPDTAGLLQLLNYFVSVCNTIAYAHSRRILHRDLKGENVIVGDFGEVVVLDWGLAKEMGEAEFDVASDEGSGAGETVDLPSRAEPEANVTLQGDRLGTPAYMAPEQAEGRIDLVDERTDVYGLAAILYEILAGSPPFEGKSVLDVLRQVVEEAPVPPRTLNADAPPELEAICLKSLAKVRDERHRSAAELADAVQAWIAERADRKRSEQERERFFALSPDLLAAVDRDGRFHQRNSAWNQTLGLDAPALGRKSLFDCMPDADAAAARRTLADVFETGRSASLENRLQHADGSHRWIDWSVSRIAEEHLVYLVGRDVTERRLQEQRFHGLLESAPDALVVIDESGTIVLANGQADRLFGYQRHELVGQPIEMLVPERFRATHPANVRGFLERPQLRAMGAGRELSGRRKDGTEFPAEISLSPVFTDAGTLVCSAVRDVTDRRRAQRLTEAMLDSSPDAMIVAQADGRIQYVNAEALKLFGYSREQLIGQPIEILLPARLREQHPRFFAEYVENPQVRRMGSGRILYGQRADGSEFAIDVSLSPIHTEDGLLVASAIRGLDPQR